MWCARRKLRTFPLMGLRHAERIGEVAMKAKTILEYGSGGSTLWLAQIAPEAKIVSVEHDEKWFRRVFAAYHALRGLGMLEPPYATLVHTSVDRYARQPADGPFDMILIDGAHETRDACLRGAFDLLSPGGTVFLHDAEEPDYQAGKVAFVKAGGVGMPFVVQEDDTLHLSDPTYNGPAELWEGSKPC